MMKDSQSEEDSSDTLISPHLTLSALHMEKNRQATRLVKDFPREKENIVLIETKISTKNETKNKEKVILDFSSSKPIINNKRSLSDDSEKEVPVTNYIF